MFKFVYLYVCTKVFTNPYTDIVLTVKLLVSPGKVYNYFEGGYPQPSKKNRSWKITAPIPFSIYDFFQI